MQHTCILCYNAQTSSSEGVFACNSTCKVMKDQICITCTRKLCSMDTPSCPNCKERLDPEVASFFAAPDNAPEEPDDQGIDRHGYVDGIYWGNNPVVEQQEPAVVEQPAVVEEPIDMRQFMPCRFHFVPGGNGRFRMFGCNRRATCPYAHTPVPCDFGPRGCLRRNTCCGTH